MVIPCGMASDQEQHAQISPVGPGGGATSPRAGDPITIWVDTELMRAVELLLDVASDTGILILPARP